MEQLLHNIELFEAYQAKLLDESAILEFEARLNSESEFRKAYQDFLSIEEGLKRHYKNEFLNQFQELDKELDKELVQHKKYSLKKIIIYTSSIAASFLIFFFGYSYYQTERNIEIAKEYWPIEPGLPVKMSSKGKYDEAMNAYKLGEFDKANTLLDKISSDTSIYFQGVIAYELNDFRASRGFFNQIEKGSLYFNNAQFRLGLILLSEGDLISAKRIFNIKKTENNLFSKESNEILKKI
jgi:TolA-binding protein